MKVLGSKKVFLLVAWKVKPISELWRFCCHFPRPFVVFELKARPSLPVQLCQQPPTEVTECPPVLPFPPTVNNVNTDDRICHAGYVVHTNQSRAAAGGQGEVAAWVSSVREQLARATMGHTEFFSSVLHGRLRRYRHDSRRCYCCDYGIVCNQDMMENNDDESVVFFFFSGILGAR